LVVSQSPTSLSDRSCFPSLAMVSPIFAPSGPLDRLITDPEFIDHCCCGPNDLDSALGRSPIPPGLPHLSCLHLNTREDLPGELGTQSVQNESRPKPQYAPDRYVPMAKPSWARPPVHSHRDSTIRHVLASSLRLGWVEVMDILSSNFDAEEASCKYGSKSHPLTRMVFANREVRKQQIVSIFTPNSTFLLCSILSCLSSTWLARPVGLWR